MPTKKGAASAAMPGQEPPEEKAMSRGAAEGMQSRPNDLTDEEIAGASQMASGASAPTLQPPPAAAASGVAGTWQSSKTITALWSINENRNAWVFVAGVGWVKLLNSSDNIIMQLTILTANAKETGGLVSYRTEADNMIHEIYVW